MLEIDFAWAVRTGQVLTLLALGWLPAWGQTSGCPSKGRLGQWAVTACTGVDTRDLRVYSPDRSKAVHVVRYRWWVELGGRRTSLSKKASYVTYPAELAWAPDNQTFYVTQSESEFGGFHTDIYRVNNDEIEQLPDLYQIVGREFDRQHECTVFHSNSKKTVRYKSSIAGFKWTSGGNQLVVVVEVPQDNICKNAGYFQGYLISIPDERVIERYSSRELARRWKDLLGERLKGDLDSMSTQARDAVP
jgi:hypothetical protein